MGKGKTDPPARGRVCGSMLEDRYSWRGFLLRACPAFQRRSGITAQIRDCSGTNQPALIAAYEARGRPALQSNSVPVVFPFRSVNKESKRVLCTSAWQVAGHAKNSLASHSGQRNPFTCSGNSKRSLISASLPARSSPVSFHCSRFYRPH
jgi:hypothetical protein